MDWHKKYLKDPEEHKNNPVR